MSTADMPRDRLPRRSAPRRLLAAVVRSGIVPDRLSSGNDASAVLANTVATAAELSAS